MSTLRDEDIQRAFHKVVPRWQLERLDTTLGTEQTAKYLRSQNQCLGVVSHAHDEDGNRLPYGGPTHAPETWCWRMDARPKAVEVQVIHHDFRESEEGVDTVLREGRISWNLLANMATVAALELRPRDPLPGEQLGLGV